MTQISLFNKYLYFPRNWAHSLSVSNKIFFTSIVLCMLPLTSNILLVIEAILLILINFISNRSQYSKLKQLKTILLYSFILLIATTIDQSSLLYICFNVYLQLNLNISIFKTSIFRAIIEDEYLTYSLCATLPSLSLRSASTIIIYFILHNIIEYSTRYEKLLLHNSYYLTVLGMKTRVLEELKIIIVLTYYYIQNNETALRNTIASIHIKGFNFSLKHANKKIYFIILLLYLRMMKTINHRFICTRIIYSKELISDYKAKWLLK